MPNREEIKKSYQIALHKGFKSFFFCLLIGIIFSVLFVSSGLNTHAVFAEETSDSDLREAIEAGDDSFVISGELILTSPLEINYDFTLTGSGTIHIADIFWHFIVNEGATLTIDGEITLYGASAPRERDERDGTLSTDSVGGGIFVNGGTLKLFHGELRYIEPLYQCEVDEMYKYGAVTLVNHGAFYMYGGMIHGSSSHGVYVDVDSTFHMYNGQISENTTWTSMFSDMTANSGAGVNTRGIFNMYGGIISENTARRCGGGVFVQGGIFNMHGGIISLNRTGASGGGVKLIREAEFNMFDGTISYNIAPHEGAGIFLASSQMNFHGGEIIYNENPERYNSSGGGISLRFESSLYITNGTIRGNSSLRGGGISISENSKAFIYDGQIKENFATRHGGGIYLSTSSTLTIESGEIISNTSLSEGGGFYLSPTSTLTIEGGEIRNNTSLLGGGGIFVWDMDKLTVGSDVIFSDNSTESSHNIGRARGRERYPQIMWYGDNSLPGTHLLNNYDINFEGRWRPANWQIALVVGGLVSFSLFITILILHKKKQKKNNIMEDL